MKFDKKDCNSILKTAIKHIISITLITLVSILIYIPVITTIVDYRLNKKYNEYKMEKLGHIEKKEQPQEEKNRK